MTKVLFCSLGHPNPTHHRFCEQCGERLNAVIEADALICDRYRVISELGRGGFGQSYLVADENRFGERCVLKVFAPEVDNGKTWTKAQELFKREADVLYRLQHPQIPRFREWFTTDRSLYMVQDYVAGQTYQTLLTERLDRGQPFTESEVILFLRQALPILTYIHHQGMIHRDISPDNLIQRLGDQLPVLIDFGGVKEITASVGQFESSGQPSRITLIGKRGYAPDEQIRLGRVSPASDIYALGVTALSLLVGQDPHTFYDPNTGTFNWEPYLDIKPELATVLDMMVATHPADRYGAAQHVLQDLKALDRPQSVARPAQKQTSRPSRYGPEVAPVSPVVTKNTQLVVSPEEAGGASTVASPPNPVGAGLVRGLRWIGVRLVILGVVLGTGAAAVGPVRDWLQQNPVTLPTFAPDPPASSPTPQPSRQPYSRDEQNRKNQLVSRTRQLGLNNTFFNRVTNEAFYLKYPNAPRRPLSTDDRDRNLRNQWDDVGFEVLDAIATLSPQARAKIGRYRQRDRTTWDQQLQDSGQDAQRFYQQATQQFEQILPMYKGVDVAGKQAEQIWYAVAANRLQTVTN